MALLHEEDNHDHRDEKKEHGAEDRYSSEPQNVHPTGEFVIVAKFNDLFIWGFVIWEIFCSSNKI